MLGTSRKRKAPPAIHEGSGQEKKAKVSHSVALTTSEYSAILPVICKTLVLFPTGINRLIAGFTEYEDRFDRRDILDPLSELSPDGLVFSDKSDIFDKFNPLYGWTSIFSHNTYDCGVHQWTIDYAPVTWFGVGQKTIGRGRRTFVGLLPPTYGLLPEVYAVRAEGQIIEESQQSEWALPVLPPEPRVFDWPCANQNPEIKIKVSCELDCDAWTVRWARNGKWGRPIPIKRGRYMFIVSTSMRTVQLDPALCVHR